MANGEPASSSFRPGLIVLRYHKKNFGDGREGSQKFFGEGRRGSRKNFDEGSCPSPIFLEGFRSGRAPGKGKFTSGGSPALSDPTCRAYQRSTTSLRCLTRKTPSGFAPRTYLYFDAIRSLVRARPGEASRRPPAEQEGKASKIIFQTFSENIMKNFFKEMYGFFPVHLIPAREPSP